MRTRFISFFSRTPELCIYNGNTGQVFILWESRWHTVKYILKISPSLSLLNPLHQNGAWKKCRWWSGTSSDLNHYCWAQKHYVRTCIHQKLDIYSLVLTGDVLSPSWSSFPCRVPRLGYRGHWYRGLDTGACDKDVGLNLGPLVQPAIIPWL